MLTPDGKKKAAEAAFPLADRLTVSVERALAQSGAHAVLFLKADNADHLVLFEALQRVAEAGFHAARQVALGHVAVNDNRHVFAQAGQEHFHLAGGHVLGFIQDNDRIFEGASAHISERRNLYLADFRAQAVLHKGRA